MTVHIKKHCSFEKRRFFLRRLAPRHPLGVDNTDLTSGK